MNTFYDNNDLIRLAEKVKDLYKNKDIVNYVHNGKKLPLKYEKLIDRRIACSHINGEPSIAFILGNAIRYSFNQSTQLNTTVASEHRTYRESCERNRIILASLKKKQSLGDKSLDADIEKKEEEIRLLQKKIDEIATLAASKPEINKNILAVAEEAFNLMLRADKTKYYFYAEICKKLGHRVNLDQLFPGFRDKDDAPNKKKDQDDDNDDYKNFMEMNVKKGAYVPPAFRKNNQEEKMNRVETIMKKEEEIQITIPKKKVEEVKEDFPIFNTQNTTPKVMGAWSKKITITPEIISSTNTNITNKTNIEKVEETIEESIAKPVITKQDNLSDNSFDENSGWGNMNSY
jgi:hypothetical protein